MNITIQKEVFSRFPKLRIALLRAQYIDNKSKLPESQHLLQEAKKLVRLTFNNDTVKTHHLIAPWAAAQKEFGKEAHHYHTALEKLLQRVLDGKEVIEKNIVQNIVNYLMLKHLVPMAADDTEQMDREVEFALASGREQGLKKGELYYRDRKQMVGAKLDYWKNPKTAVTPKTESVLIHVDALPPFPRSRVKELLIEAQQLLTTFCGGKTRIVVLWRRKPTAMV